MRTRDDLARADRDLLWHPYAPPSTPAPLPVVRSARGARLVIEDERGTHEVVDAMASWWCAIHGYRHPDLDDAVRSQVDAFSHVMFGGLTHAPAVELAEALVDLAPEGLTRVFLADSGSVAMEVALKVVRQVALARTGGDPTRARTRFATLRGGYHGDTWGAMSVCDPDGGMHHLYAGQVQQHVFLPRPPRIDADDVTVAAWRDEADAVLADHLHEVAGIVCEPMLQGAGGMWAYHPDVLRHLRRVADEHDLVLVLDEIATGFGRTGTLWGADHAGVVPDVCAVGKALTGGYVTQAAVLTTDAVARAIARGPGGALMHGPTFMANPLACAVSLASLRLVAEGTWRTDVPRIAATLGGALAPLADHPHVTDVRVLGATAAVQLAAPVDLAVATRVALDHGVWLRPFRDLVYAMPPYVTTDDELRQVAAAMAAAVDALEEHHARR